ncbi:molybdenum cofactor guanylyltransferase [Spirulina subsalsa FACHB-351]|uniref:Probable molybdenum cofactor guanylyltransferase n=1 Tax=Spirulina subsalsa FACHB-351 TaxID=234711 RepID=A0ABT3L2A5_9CYAN|nr:molybdenum cofactor guanylyltransferase [Spirulina subsalsa]MCW6035639.1 molybdenum cofactor guanylyltransferase [Spirulina subsalsa FACHB-351]
MLSPPPLTVYALVLAGGQSSRMGQDKALIPYQNIPLLQRVLKVAESCCSQVYILTPWPERYQELCSSNIQFLGEKTPGQGSLVALVEGLDQLAQFSLPDWVLLLACDLPYLQEDIIKAWIKDLENLEPNILAVVPKSEKYWQPLCAFYRPHIIPYLQQYLGQNRRSFQGLLEQVEVKPLAINSRVDQMLFNCNTPEDLENLED